MPNLLMLKGVRLVAFSGGGRGLFPAPDRSFPLLAGPCGSDFAIAFGAARKSRNTGPPRTGVPGTARSQRQEPRGEKILPADKDKNGRVEREELLASRRKAFAKLDRDGNGALAFDEWATKTIDKFAGADKDRSGWLDAAEYSTTAPPPPKKKRCSC